MTWAMSSVSGRRGARMRARCAVVATPTLERAFARWCFTVECERPRRLGPSRRPRRLGRRGGRQSLEPVELLPVRRGPLLADRGERSVGIGALSHERLLDPDQAGVFQLGQVAREVALGETGRALQEHEVGGAHRGQDGQDREAGRLVDESIEDELVATLRHGCPPADRRSARGVSGRGDAGRAARKASRQARAGSSPGDRGRRPGRPRSGAVRPRTRRPR